MRTLPASGGFILVAHSRLVERSSAYGRLMAHIPATRCTPLGTRLSEALAYVFPFSASGRNLLLIAEKQNE